jgi:hypothetical protein
MTRDRGAHHPVLSDICRIGLQDRSGGDALSRSGVDHRPAHRPRSGQPTGPVMGGVLTLSALIGGLFPMGLPDLPELEQQVILLSLIAIFVFSALGGAWFPLEVTGQDFATIGHLVPTGWAMDGFQNIIARGQGLASVLPPAGILLVYTVAFYGVAVWCFRVESRVFDGKEAAQGR